MHLKDLGNLKNATTAITSVFGGVDKNSKGNFDEVVSKLSDGLKDCSLECVKLATKQMNLTAIQAKAIFTAKGLSGAELDAAIKTATLSASQKEATATTLGLGTATKELRVQLNTLATTTWGFLLLI